MGPFAGIVSIGSSGLSTRKCRFEIGAVANIDPEKNLILVNWNHPARIQMEEKSVLYALRSAWIVAREAAHGNADYMMDLALKLVSFSFPDENDRVANS